MNNIILTGNMVKDSELTTVGNKQTPKLSFTIANNEGYGDNKKTTFINCVLWGKSAENLANYLLKGTKILVKGKLDIRSYDDKEGNKKYITEVVVDMFGGVELLGSKSSNNQGGGNNESWNAEPIDNGDMPF